MSVHSSPSSPPRRAAAAALALIVFVVAIIALVRPAQAQMEAGPIPLGFGEALIVTKDPGPLPPGGWVLADLIAETGCVPVSPNRTICFGYTVETVGLYELPSMQIRVGRSYGGPETPSGYQITRHRPACTVQGQLMFYPEGAWHFGQRWTKKASWSYWVRPGYEGVPPEYRQYDTYISYEWKETGTRNYAFFPIDECSTLLASITQTPTPPGGGGGGNLTPTPPGMSLTTPTRLPELPPTTTPTATPRCDRVAIDPIPLTLFVGEPAALGTPGDPYNNYGRPFAQYAGYYSGADGSRRYAGASWAQMIAHDLRSIDNPPTIQDRSLWVQVPSNVVVEARYHFEQAVSMFDRSTVARNRNAMLILQDLGTDRQPGGGDDRLLAFLSMGDASLFDNPANRRLKVQGSHLDFYPRLNLPGRPSGWQAYRDGSVRVWSNAFFSWVGNQTDPYAWQPWPLPEQRDANGRLTRFAQDWLYTNELEANRGPLQLRFITQPGRAYRMVMLNQVPGCNTDILSTMSQLYFFTEGGANVAVEKTAPQVSTRNQMIGYSLTVRNTSQETVNTVVLTDTLPSGVVFGETTLTLRNPTTGETYTEVVTGTASVPPTQVNGQTLTWNLGHLGPGQERSIALFLPVTSAAPNAITNVAVITAANDSNPSDNRAEATTALVETNVRVRLTTPRIVRPGETFNAMIDFDNTSGGAATNTLLTFKIPPGVTLISTTRPVDDMGENQTLIWRIGTLNGGQSGSVGVRMRVDDPATVSALIQLARISADADAEPLDNAAQATTVVLVTPPPAPEEQRLRIHSEFDPERGVYISSGQTVRWPGGEVMDFTPFIVMREDQPGLPYYRIDRKIVAWSFLGSGGLNATGQPCKEREEPRAEETQHADLTRMRGCVYRYHINPSPEQMQQQGHLFWSQFRPETMRNDVYVVTPLPTAGTDLRIQYAVLTEVVETGYMDVDGDGREDSVLDRRTDVFDVAYRVELVVPRDVR